MPPIRRPVPDMVLYYAEQYALNDCRAVDKNCGTFGHAFTSYYFFRIRPIAFLIGTCDE